MRRPVLVGTLLLLACPPSKTGGLVVTLELDRTVVNDGTVMRGTVSFVHTDPVNVEPARLTMTTSLGVVTPATGSLAPNDFQQVTYSCDLATNAGCLGQAVITAELETAHDVAVATATVQVLEPDDGSVRQFDGGLCGGGVFPGAGVSCCFDPATNNAPLCGWSQVQSGQPFFVPLVTADGGTAFSEFTITLPSFVGCAGGSTGHAGDAGLISFACRGYGIDGNTGAWRLLADTTCTPGDAFLSQQLCPALSSGGFFNGAWVMTDVSVAGVGVSAPTTGAFLVFQN
jgi:hypothetical protein